MARRSRPASLQTEAPYLVPIARLTCRRVEVQTAHYKRQSEPPSHFANDFFFHTRGEISVHQAEVRHVRGPSGEVADPPGRKVSSHQRARLRGTNEKTPVELIQAIDKSEADCEGAQVAGDLGGLREHFAPRSNDAPQQGDVRLENRRGMLSAEAYNRVRQAALHWPAGHEPERIGLRLRARVFCPSPQALGSRPWSF